MTMQKEQAFLAKGSQKLSSGDVKGALEIALVIIGRNPGILKAHLLAAQAYLAIKQYDKALEYLKSVDALQADIPEVLLAIANTASLLGKESYAIDKYARFLQFTPDNIQANANISSLLIKNDRLSEAAKYLEISAKLAPDNQQVLVSLSVFHRMMLDFPTALSAYKTLVKLHPDDMTLGQSYVRTLDYNPEANAEDNFSEIVNFARKIESAHPKDFKFDSTKPSEKKLRVGYVSSDMRSHSVTFFLLPILEHHSNDIEVFTYHTGDIEDQETEKIAGLAHVHRHISNYSNREACEIIRNDGIDVLFDLNGHTHAEKLGIFAYRSAPVQIAWIGYPNTTGLEAMDYRITDFNADPEGESEQFYTEKLIRMPNIFSVYSAPANSPGENEPPRMNNGFVTFGSFNNPQKLNEPLIKIWSRVLLETENSRLILKYKDIDSNSMSNIIRNIFGKFGVSPDRIQLEGHTENTTEHLAMYGLVDIALDTFPYNGTTTSCEALWQGVPVIALSGKNHAGRVGVSQLLNMGLPDLIGLDEDDYVKKAVNLAANAKRLTELRKTLRERMLASPLMDAASFTRCLEEKIKEYAV